MRRLSLSAGLLPLIFSLVCACAQANTILHLRADRIAFYYDQFLVEADGRVQVQTSDGFQVSGDAFSMDLKLNRFLIAGHVTMTSKGTRISGAAISDFLDFNRVYLLPVTSAPDRWTYLNGDLANPVKGRIMPGDVFYFPNVSGTPSLTAGSATIGTRSYARFTDATTYLAGAGVPLKSFVVDFSPNQYLAQNSLSGANFDVTWNFAGNNNSLSALHIRYDKTNYGPYFAFEQHLAGSHDYAVFSINPLTKYAKFLNLQLYEQLGSRFQIQTFTQYYDQQRLFEEPHAAAQTTYITSNYAFPHSYLSAYSILTNYNMLGSGAYTAQYGSSIGSEAHPSSVQLTWTSFNNRIGKLPLYEQTYFSEGFNHDSVGNVYNGVLPIGSERGLQNFGGYTYTTIYNSLIGYTLSMPALKFGNLNNAYDTYYFNAYLNAQRQWYMALHHVNTTTGTVSVSRQIARPLSAYAAYQIQNTSDIYNVGGYGDGYCSPKTLSPPCTVPVYPINCQTALNPDPCDYNVVAFRGAQTLRTYDLALNYLPNPDFNFTLLGRKHNDFPGPFPYQGTFQSPLYNVIGQPLSLNYLGQPPYDLTGDVRFRVLPHMMLDVQRTYYFNFGYIKWSPSFIVQVLPQ